MERLAFPLVAREGAWIVFIDSDLSVGGSGRPKPPHVHVKLRGGGKQFSYWLETSDDSEENETITVVPRAGSPQDGDAKHAFRLAQQYRAEALALYHQHVERAINRNRERGGAVAYIPDVTVIEWEPDHHLVLLVDSTKYLVDFRRFPIFLGADEMEIHDCEAFDEDWIHWFGLDADVLLDSLLVLN